MTQRFVAIGECMVELAPAETTGFFQRSFAGDTFNTTWYLKRLRPDWHVEFLTRVGRDEISDEMVSLFDTCGLGTENVQRADDRSIGLYMISLQDGERSFSYWRGQSAARQLAQDGPALANSFSGADMLYFSGITLAILEDHGRENLFTALSNARNAGAKIAFDSNLRPKLWPSESAMCDAVMQAAAISDIVLPSHDDEAAYFGDSNPDITLRRYVSAGAKTVVVKNGANPILYSHDGTKGQINPQPVSNIVDTTAAGDSFNAGFFAGLPGGIDAAIVQGSRLAGKVIAGKGALVEVT